jgi:hypothetical protein
MALMADPPAHDESHGNPLVWALQPGEAIERETLHERYGGRAQGRIAVSRRSPNLFLFWDPAAVEPDGYFDGWRADGCFHHSGEGLRGDQQMKSGNAAIRDHLAEGHALRLMLGARGRVTYEGQFELAPDPPFYTTDSPEANNGPERSVIVFRLRPLDVRPKPSSSRLDRVLTPAVEDMPVEEQWTEKAFLAPRRKGGETDKRAQALMLAFHQHLLGQGHQVARLRIAPAGEAKPLFCDLIDRTANTLFVVKGTVERGAIRTAVGQLLDYSRFVEPPPSLAVVLPSRPRDDLRALLERAGIEQVWQEGKKFKGSREG